MPTENSQQKNLNVDLGYGVYVQMEENGSTNLAFDTPLKCLALAEMLYDQSVNRMLLQQVKVIDPSHGLHGQKGWISSIEHSNGRFIVFVTFYTNEANNKGTPEPFSLAQIELVTGIKAAT